MRAGAGRAPRGRGGSRTGGSARLLGLLGLLGLSAGCGAGAAAGRAEPEPGTFTLVAGGDVLLAQPGWRGPRLLGGDAPLAGVADLLAGADAAFVNLESPLCPGGTARAPRDAAHPRFGAPPERVGGLAAAGVDWVNLANNHALDCGEEGVVETLAAVRRAGMLPVGVADTGADALTPSIAVVRGVRVGVLAVSLVGPAPARLSHQGPGGDAAPRVAVLTQAEARRLLPDAVRRLAGRVSVVVVSLHWGVEMTPRPRPEQVELAHLLVDAGADLVIGHHPHVLQPVERYGDGVIAYSLGNLVFDMARPEARRSALLEVSLGDGPGGWSVRAVRLWPVAIDEGVPTLQPFNPSTLNFPLER